MYWSAWIDSYRVTLAQPTVRISPDGSPFNLNSKKREINGI
jgi:hypothetical protein